MKNPLCSLLCLAALTLPLAAEERAKPKIIPSLTVTGEGSLGDLIDTLRKETGVGIIVEAGLSQTLPAPKLLLTNVTVESVMHALGELMPSISIKSQGVPTNEIYTISTRTQELPKEVFRRVTRIFKVGGEAMRGGAGASAVRSSTLSVKYLKAAEVIETLKSEFGASAASAVISSDPRTNSLVLNEAHPDAARVRLFVERLDQRPMTLVVKTEVRRVDAAHPEGVVIARPSLVTLPGKPASISIGEKGDQLTIELTVTPEGTAEGLSNTLEQLREQAEQARKQKDAGVQKLEDVLKKSRTGAAPSGDRRIPRHARTGIRPAAPEHDPRRRTRRQRAAVRWGWGGKPDRWRRPSPPCPAAAAPNPPQSSVSSLTISLSLVSSHVAGVARFEQDGGVAPAQVRVVPVQAGIEEGDFHGGCGK